MRLSATVPRNVSPESGSAQAGTCPHRGYGLQTLPLQIGLGFPSARSSIGSAVKVVSTSRSRVIFVSVFIGSSFQKEKFWLA